MSPGAARCLRPIVLLLIVAGALEGAARVAIRLLDADPRFDFRAPARRLADLQSGVTRILEAQGRSLVQLDPELGWVHAANYRGELYSTNSRALRGMREYADQPPSGVLRVAAFGDSFVFSNEVSDRDAWPARIEALDPSIEILNYGVGGFGTDQALLLMRRHLEDLDPDLVILGFPEVDYARNVSRFRGFAARDDLPLVKPRFVLDEEGKLKLLPPSLLGERLRDLVSTPERIFEVASDDWFYSPTEWSNPLYAYSGLVRFVSSVTPRVWRARIATGRLHRDGVMNTDSEAFRLLVALVRTFSQEVTRSGRTFLLVTFPVGPGEIWGSEPLGYTPLLDALPHVRILDLAQALRADPALTPEAALMPSQHYSPAANATAARAILAYLREQRAQPAHGMEP
jgi:hypothetical protein